MQLAPTCTRASAYRDLNHVPKIKTIKYNTKAWYLIGNIF